MEKVQKWEDSYKTEILLQFFFCFCQGSRYFLNFSVKEVVKIDKTSQNLLKFSADATL